jgi:hypothetical protein
MNNCLRIAARSLLLVFSSFAWSADPATNEITAADKIDQFIQDAPLFLKDKTMPGIRNLGKIVKEETKKEPNPYIQGTTMLIKEFHFEGLQIVGVVVDSKKENDPMLLNSIVVTQPQWKILNGLDVGTTAEKIEQVLGAPSEKSEKAISYNGAGNHIYFHLKQGKIEKIVISYYGG